MSRDESVRFLRAHKLWRPEGEQPDLRFEFDLGEIVELLGDRPVQLLGASRALVSGESTLVGVIEGVVEQMYLRFAKARPQPARRLGFTQRPALTSEALLAADPDVNGRTQSQVAAAESARAAAQADAPPPSPPHRRRRG